MAKLRLNDYINVILDANAAQGIRRIGAKVAADVEAATGTKSQIILPVPDAAWRLPQAVIVAELGRDALADTLAARLPELETLRGKWECYGFYLAKQPLPGVEEGLVIVGSDRIGTIYGMFHLSELLGVTAWGFWGDVAPPPARSVILTDEDLTCEAACGNENYPEGVSADGEAWQPQNISSVSARKEAWQPQGVSARKEGGRSQAAPAEIIRITNGISREPSVKYRGFFINDEWPCFGNWTFSHYGGFTAEMYDKIFEYLLRMKGNYLWPAMWTSSFLLDGPGLASMELATEYGIYIGMSHHEPCMRSGAEFSIFKGEDSPYGNDWSYVTNKEGLLKFWEDGLARVRGQNVFPTVGMRGENDTKMLGDHSTIGENVRLLKEIITEQRKLIAKHINPDLKKVPQLLAIYKEVEDYFFGNEEASGLRGFEELNDVTLMFCEDNFNNMRALPQEAAMNEKLCRDGASVADMPENHKMLAAHPGGYGMYYHVDYHGSPISYEWVNSTPITKIWEQMTEAWEYGIREVWILNVGDVKFNEYPLGYFLALAYDFDTYGTAGLENTLAYSKEWVRSLFGKQVDEEQLCAITWVLKESVSLHSLRRAEAQNDTVYHPAHYGETQKLLERAEALEKKNEELRAALQGSPCADGYYSVIYFPAAGIANLLKMHLAAGLNHLYSSQGKAVANRYGEILEACIARDRALAEELAAFRGGKWSGMEREEHIGFVNWNDEDFRYPVRHLVTLPGHPRLVVSRADRTDTFTNQYFPVPLQIRDFENAGADLVTLQVANGGQGAVSWQVEGTSEYFEITPSRGETELQTEVTIRVLRDRLPEEGTVEFSFRIRAGRESVPLVLTAKRKDTGGIPDGAFLIQDGICVWDAADYAEAFPHVEPAFRKLEEYGKYGSGMKVFPTTAIFDETDWRADQAPRLTYEVWAEEAGAYRLSLHTSPANPLVSGGRLAYGLSVNRDEIAPENPAKAPGMEERTDSENRTAPVGRTDSENQTAPASRTDSENQTAPVGRMGLVKSSNTLNRTGECGGITEDIETVRITPDGYRGGDPGCADWCRAVLDQEHVASTWVDLRKGLNRITVYAGDAGIALERLTLEQEGREILPSYLGAPKSCRAGSL